MTLKQLMPRHVMRCEKMRNNGISDVYTSTQTAKLDLYDHFPNTDGAIYALRRQINKELVKIIIIFLACLRRFLSG